MAGCVLTVSARSSAGPLAIRAEIGSPSAASAAASRPATSGWAAKASSIPTFWEPCPGNTQAIVIVVSHARQHGAPGKAAADPFHEHMLPRTDATVAHRDVERQRHRGGGRVGVAVDRDDHPLDRQAQLAGGRLQYAHVRLVGNQPVDRLEIE